MRMMVLVLALTLLASGCAQVPSLPHEGSAGPDPAHPVEAAAGESGLDAEQGQPLPVEAAGPVLAPARMPPADIWERIRGGFRMSNLEGPLVREWEQWYATRPDYVARMVDRGSHFLYHVLEAVEQRGMPAEIALLPMIESAYNPRAYSRSHASGMWQFIPSTGLNYGLPQNYWYDARRDPIAATSAALDYLGKLHGMFGSWELALAAYNWGEGAVSRAIARNQARGLPADYESLTMPPETRSYVPKLQAVKNIIANPQAFGLTLSPVPNRPYFTTVTTGRHIDVKLAARFAEMPLDEFQFLNPAHNRPVIKAGGQQAILLPLDRVAVFRRNLEAHDKPLVSWQAYTVRRSDKPEAIARHHGISLGQLYEVNGINGKRRIVAGQTIMVPVKAGAEPNLPDLPVPKTAKARLAAAAKPAPARNQAASARGKRPAATTRATGAKAKTKVASGKRGKPVRKQSGRLVVAESGKVAAVR
ncbi:MAG: transglycosylase SLT domain-containing protein [Burkholderiales bacterium]|nr:transglycosylase SLT domain-containing protein [Burkholderiales bacterium]